MTNSKNEASQAPDPGKDTSWWNRPLLGKKGLIESIVHNKNDVPKEALINRKTNLSDLYIFAKTAEAIDSKIFLEPEFLSYIKIKYMMDNDIGEYAGLKQSYRYLELAIDVKDLLIFIDQTELRYRGYKQQEFYDQVLEILKEGDEAETFKQKLELGAKEAIAQTKTPEGQQALVNYVDNLKQISDNPLGLDLLKRFRTLQLSDYSVLAHISELIRNIEIRHVYDMNRLVQLANDNIALFGKISEIIQVPQEKNNTRSFAIMVQFIALGHQHKITALKFEELVKVLRLWLKYYSKIQEIQLAYPEADYKQPPEFTIPIPGEAVYRKYLNALTDKNQEIYYYDLGQSVTR